jgi:hypothetical protein
MQLRRFIKGLALAPLISVALVGLLSIPAHAASSSSVALTGPCVTVWVGATSITVCP